jgi:hypothetical protein
MNIDIEEVYELIKEVRKEKGLLAEPDILLEQEDYIEIVDDKE